MLGSCYSCCRAEFGRADICNFPLLVGCPMVASCRIFFSKEQGTLYYCGRQLEGERLLLDRYILCDDCLWGWRGGWANDCVGLP
jgi:hypothetical protein